MSLTKEPHLAHINARMTAKRWARNLITKLFRITHKRWLLRNARVHIKRKGDMNEEDHSKQLAKMKKLVWTNPEDILPGNAQLLNEDFNTLGRASSLDQQL